LKEHFGNLIDVDNSIYDKIVYGSETERKFAKALNERKDIKLFVKLPNWFKIDTPVGTYNPDWAIVKQPPGGEEKLYLVKETKGSKNYEQLRTIESYKIRCGKKHFESLHTGIEYAVATIPGEV
jgi:type III restriction enzyme